MDNHKLLVSSCHNFDWYKCCRHLSIGSIRGKLKLILDQEDHDGVNECSMRQFAGIMCTQLLYLPYSQKESNISGGVRRRLSRTKKETKSNGLDTAGSCCSTGNKKHTKNSRYNLSELADSDEGGCVKDIKRPSDEIKYVYIGNKRFKQDDTVSSTSSTSEHKEDDVYSHMKREGMTNRQILSRVGDSDVLQQMRDIGGGTHTACKLPVTVSKGKTTKGKRYVNQRLCKWNICYKCFN